MTNLNTDFWRYDPDKVTDWVTPLENIYAKQSKQLELWHNQLRARDNQEEAVANSQSTLNTISKLADFSTSILNAVKISKAENERQKAIEESKQYGLIDQTFKTADDRKFIQMLTDTYDVGKDGVLKDAESYLKEIEKRRKLSEESVAKGGPDFFDSTKYNYLKDNSPSKQLRMREVLATDKVYTAEANYQNDIISNPKWNSRVDAADGNPDELLRIRREWWAEYIGLENYSDPFYAKFIAPEKQRFFKTKLTNDRVKANQVRLTTETVNYENEQDAFLKPGLEKDLGSLEQATINKIIREKGYVNIEGGLTATQQAVEDWVEIQTRLIKSKNNSKADLDLILNSKVKSKGDGGEYKTLKEVYLSGKKGDHGKQLYNKLVAAEGERLAADFAVSQATELAALSSVTARIESGETSSDEIAKVKEAALIRGKAMGLQDTPEYKLLERIDPTIYDEEHIGIYKDKYKAYYTGDKMGSAWLDTAIIDAIPNGVVRAELQKLAADQKQHLLDLKLPITRDGWIKRGQANLIASNPQQGAKIFGGLGGTLTNEAYDISIELVNAELRALEIGRQQHTEDREDAKLKGDRIFDDEKVKHGLDVTDEPGAVGVGKWSATREGVYKQYAHRMKIESEKVDVGDAYDLRKWGRDTDRVKRDRTKRALPNAELQGTFIKNGRDVDQISDLQFSKETRYKAWALKTTASALVLKDLTALKNSNKQEDKDYKKLFPNLEDKIKLIETSPEITLAAIVESIGDEDATDIFNEGLHRASPLELELFWLKLQAYEKQRNTVSQKEGT